MKSTIIGIAGGTGSGKSTFTNKIKKEFGNRVSVLYHDNYYKSRDDVSIEDRKSINYDHPDAFETELLIEHICNLKNGKIVECPIYDYSQHNRTAKTFSILPTDVIIVEGILVFQDERLRNLFDIKIFVEADADERILRRIIRDVQERGRDVEGIAEQYLNSVKPMHYVYVQPTKNYADIVINSGMNEVAFDLLKTKIVSLLND